jgi:hypothetical protein
MVALHLARRALPGNLFRFPGAIDIPMIDSAKSVE